MVMGGQRHASAALPQRKRQVSFAQEAGSAAVTIFTEAEKRKSLAPNGVQTPKRPNHYSEAIPAFDEVIMLIKSRTMTSAQNVAHVVFKWQ